LTETAARCRESLSAWDLVEVAVARCGEMDAKVATEPCPFIDTMTRTGTMDDLLSG